MLEFLQPVSDSIIDFVSILERHTVGKNCLLHTSDFFPELLEGSVVLFSVSENRNNNEYNTPSSYDNVRKQLYKLAKGSWSFDIVDLGEIVPGEKVSDTYFAVTELVKTLLSKKCIPVVLGNGQDLVMAQYNAYSVNDGTVNIVNIDSCFDLGNVDLPINNKSYLGKIVMGQPYNLFNYTNIGYQSYFVAPEELDLMDKMYFDSYRLGEVINDITITEPVFRDADIVSVDLNSLSAPFYGNQPNGFSGREVCALARYAGISDKVSNFGIYEYDSKKTSVIGDALVSQILWYFIEGVSCRWNESGDLDSMEVVHYQVPVNEEVYSFYKSKITQRWWIKVSYNCSVNNNLPVETLLPCTYDDYEKACNQIVPEKWYNAKMKYEL